MPGATALRGSTQPGMEPHQASPQMDGWAARRLLPCVVCARVCCAQSLALGVSTVLLDGTET